MMPRLIAHCDWSTSIQKRWICKARIHRGNYEVAEPRPVGALGPFFSQLREEEPTGSILAGFDFPIGVPRLYAEKAAISKFTDALLRFGEREWAEFYHPAAKPHQISIRRPFFPLTPGGTKKQQLVDGLGLAVPSDLLRRCDLATTTRPRACEVFWTLGANQVGRAAISGWRDLITPAIREDRIRLWPFEGDVEALLGSNKIVVAETYPGEIYSHLALPRGFGKRRKDGRAGQADAILTWCENNQVVMTLQLHADIRDGFGEAPEAKDKFDSFIGLLGMIEVVQKPAMACPPEDPWVKDVEGWILGMKDEHAQALPGFDSPEIHNAKPAEGRQLVNPQETGPPPRVCPACEKKIFVRWPSGWDSHAAHRCSGVEGDTAEERKRAYNAKYLR
jgi:hypothetical protein